MTFCPEWLTGSPNLDTSNWLFLWVYLVVSSDFRIWDAVLSDNDDVVHERYVSSFCCGFTGCL